jgi:hypothetical protein
MYCPCKVEGRIDSLLQTVPELPSESVTYLALTEASQICLHPKQAKVLLYAKDCGPEPNCAHYRDMMTVTSALGPGYLTVVNLAGSGASVLQHFHAQYLAKTWIKDGQSARRADSMIGQVDKLQLGDNCDELGGGIKLSAVHWPLWGLVIEFHPTFGADATGLALFQSIHEEVRYRSQLHIAYNVYIDSGNWRRIIVLFGESRLERVCETREFFKLTERVAGLGRATNIAASPNQRWRWGWMESAGALMARDNSFTDQPPFDLDFWKQVYGFLKLPEAVQLRVYGQVKDSLARWAAESRACDAQQ